LTQTLEQIVSKFGQVTRAKHASASLQGEPEDQLRAPFEHLLLDLAELAGLPRRICEGPTIPASALPLGLVAGHRKAGAEAADTA